MVKKNNIPKLPAKKKRGATDITPWMVKNVITARETQTVFEACQILFKNRIGALIVIDRNKKPIGIFTERDLLNRVVALDRNPKKLLLSEVMTKGIKVATAAASYQEVYGMMSENNIRHLPIVENEMLVAIVSMRDLLRYSFFKKIDQETISAWMIKEVVTVNHDQTVYDACKLMHEHKIGSVIVVSKKKPVGIVTERDILTKVVAEQRDYNKTCISDIMTTDIKFATTKSGYKEVYELMNRNNIRHLPIVEKGRLVAIVSIRDLLRFNMRSMEQIISEQMKELNFVKGMFEKTSDQRNRELLKLNEQLQGLIIVDNLTGLYNHKYFEEILIKELARANRYNRPVSLLFIDIDFFKHYNDVNGHERGNVVLKQLSEVLRKTSRHSDTVFKMEPIDIVARYGGEEFVIIMPETDKKGGVARAKRLISDVKEYPFYNREAQPGGTLTISVGVSEFPLDAREWSDLIRKADEGLYKAKNSGRDKVCTC